MDLLECLKNYVPDCPQEEKDRASMLAFYRENPDALDRENRIAHFTVSAVVIDPERESFLFVYHKLYDSWSWMGGHADGETDLLKVAGRELFEESGLKDAKPLLDGSVFSLEILPVSGHEKRGDYVSSHLHLNLSFLFEGDPKAPVASNPRENSAVRWFPFSKALEASTEPWMVERIYKKLIRKIERRKAEGLL